MDRAHTRNSEVISQRVGSDIARASVKYTALDARVSELVGQSDAECLIAVCMRYACLRARRLLCPAVTQVARSRGPR
jgi:hypothetical protein